jgi:hypothetical protein
LKSKNKKKKKIEKKKEKKKRLVSHTRPNCVWPAQYTQPSCAPRTMGWSLTTGPHRVRLLSHATAPCQRTLLVRDPHNLQDLVANYRPHVLAESSPPSVCSTCEAPGTWPPFSRQPLGSHDLYHLSPTIGVYRRRQHVCIATVLLDGR